MKVPILRLNGNLIVTLQETLTDADLVSLKSDLSEQVGRQQVRGVIIDVTVLEVMDSFSTRTLRDISRTTKLRGAEMVIVGIQPEVAFAMVQLGLRLEGVYTARDLDEGMALLRTCLRERDTRDA